MAVVVPIAVAALASQAMVAAEEAAVNAADVKEKGEKDDWVMSYYKKPTPEQFVEKVRALFAEGAFEPENAQPPLIAFMSQVMAANPKQIPAWLEALKTLDETQLEAIYNAAWFSDTKEARAFFKKEGIDVFLKEKAPNILEEEVNDPAKLDMLWGYFFATGSEAPIRKIISALELSKYEGALKRYKTSGKTEKDQKEVYLEVTFQAAQWSLESNCRQQPMVLMLCEKIFKEPGLPKAQSFWLAALLSKVAPERYRVELPK